MEKIKLVIAPLSLCCLLSFSVSAQVKDIDPAKVGIIDFVERNGLKKYTSFEKKLSDAIDEALSKKFKYQKTQKRENELALTNILKAETTQKKDLSWEHIEKLADENNLDIIVFGYYEELGQGQGQGQGISDEIRIEPHLYLKGSGRILALEGIQGKVKPSADLISRTASLYTEKVSALLGPIKNPGEGSHRSL